MEHGNLVMELTPEMQKTLIPFFNIEVEVMQGIVEDLPNGSKKYTLQINDQQKGELIMSFCCHVIANTVEKVNLN